MLSLITKDLNAWEKVFIERLPNNNIVQTKENIARMASRFENRQESSQEFLT